GPRRSPGGGQPRRFQPSLDDHDPLPGAPAGLAEDPLTQMENAMDVLQQIEKSRASAAKPLLGQRALVTGSSSGIGRGVALALARAGADVAVNYVSTDGAAEQLVAEIRKTGGVALAVRADISDEEQVQSMFQKTISEFGSVDILVNNAGIQQDAAFDQMSLKQWNRVLGVNLTGQF